MASEPSTPYPGVDPRKVEPHGCHFLDIDWACCFGAIAAGFGLYVVLDPDGMFGGANVGGLGGDHGDHASPSPS